MDPARVADKAVKAVNTIRSTALRVFEPIDISDCSYKIANQAVPACFQANEICYVGIFNLKLSVTIFITCKGWCTVVL